MAALISNGPAPQLLWRLAPRSFTSQDLLEMLLALPRQGGRLVVVLDKGSIHYLPSYSPQLNPIEAVFGGIKAHGLPERSYSTVPALTEARARLLDRQHSLHQLGLAA